jgi:hypothetical protein
MLEPRAAFPSIPLVDETATRRCSWSTRCQYLAGVEAWVVFVPGTA